MELVCAAIADAAARGTACLVLGRDPALRAIAERDGWRQLALVGELLRPLSLIAVEGVAIDELLADAGSAPIAPARPAAIDPVSEPPLPNVLPFPLAARPAGAR